MSRWIDDATYAARRLLRSPGFSLTALLILLLGIGVNTTAFSFVNSLLLQPPPFEEPESVVLVLQDSDGGTPNSTSYPAYLDMTRYDDVFAHVSAFYTEEVFLEQDEALRPIRVEYATASYLDAIGLAPSRGRWFEALMDDADGPPAAVLTYKMWSERLGADPDVVGSTVRIGGRSIEVIGVGPEVFNGGMGPASVDLWLSVSAIGPTGGRVWSLTRREDHPFRVRARLQPAVSVEEASSAMTLLAEELATTYPTLNTDRDITVIPVTRSFAFPEMASGVIPAAALAMIVVTLVLLIASLNLANLLLVRTTARARELAVRLALGAGRRALIRVVLAEAMILAAVGGALGLALAFGVTRFIANSQFDFGLRTVIDVRLDARVMLFAFLVSVGTGLVFGLLPALRATSSRLAGSLHDDSTTAIGARRRFGLTGALVAGQVAVSLLLLAIGGVFLESLTRAQGADPGFAWERTAYASVNLQPLDLDPAAAPLMYDRLVERLAALPGVTGLSSSIRLPGALFGTTTLLLGSGTGGVDRPTEIPWNVVSPDFFRVLGVPVLHGRTFTETDAEGPTVAIVSEAMARTYWGRTDVVGQSYRSESRPDEAVEIIGVVGDLPVRALGETAQPSLYWPSGASLSFGSFLIVTDGDPDQLVGPARAAISEVDERILILDVAPMAHHLGSTLERQRLAGALLGALGALALMLAVIGVYGVVSFAVSRRRREVGIRIALGAKSESVVGLFVRDVAGVVLLGAALGLLVAVPLSGAVGRIFTGSAGSPVATTGAAALLVAAALLATVLPAARAARTNPTAALRQE